MIRERAFVTIDQAGVGAPDGEQMAVYAMGIVGGNRPSTYSKSPALWNEWCDLVSFRGQFEAHDVAEPDIRGFLRSVWNRRDFVELTVTNPYKRVAFEVFQESIGEGPGRVGDPEHPQATVWVDPAARRLESMNHLIRGPGGSPTRFENTDGRGLVAEVPASVWRDARVLIIGAGGAAISVADALAGLSASLSFTDLNARDADTAARRVSDSHGAHTVSVLPFRCLSSPEIESVIEQTDVVVAAVSGGSPLSPECMRAHSGRLTVIDTRYGPEALTFNAARSAGVTAYDGLFMLFGQFALAARVLAEFHGIPTERNDRALNRMRSRFLAR